MEYAHGALIFRFFVPLFHPGDSQEYFSAVVERRKSASYTALAPTVLNSLQV